MAKDGKFDVKAATRLKKDFSLETLYGRFQRIDRHRGPAASYAKVHKPLPKPPPGMEWVLEEDTREWRLERLPDQDVVADAGVIYDDADDNQLDSSDDKSSDPSRRRDPQFFLEHRVQATDTLADICQMYKLTPSELRRANPNISDFSSSVLAASNQKLNIPYRASDEPMIEKPVQAQQLYPLPTPEHKLEHLCKSFEGMNRAEARCYLDFNDWNLQLALQNAEEDGFESSAAAKRRR